MFSSDDFECDDDEDFLQAALNVEKLADNDQSSSNSNSVANESCTASISPLLKKSKYDAVEERYTSTSLFNFSQEDTDLDLSLPMTIERLVAEPNQKNDSKERKQPAVIFDYTFVQDSLPGIAHCSNASKERPVRNVQSALKSKEDCDRQMFKLPGWSGPENAVKRKRKFPGPAGVLPQLKPGSVLDDKIHQDRSASKISNSTEVASSSICSQSNSEDYLNQAAWSRMNDELEPEARHLLRDFSIQSIISKANLKSLPLSKVPIVCAAIESVNIQSVDASILLKDLTGVIHGTIHRELLKDYAPYLQSGTVLVLRQVGVLSPSGRNFYLNITSSNLVRLYAKEVRPDGQSTMSVKRNREFTVEDFASPAPVVSIQSKQTLSRLQASNEQSSSNLLFHQPFKPCRTNLLNQAHRTILSTKVNQTGQSSPIQHSNRATCVIPSNPPFSTVIQSYSSLSRYITPGANETVLSSQLTSVIQQERSPLAVLANQPLRVSTMIGDANLVTNSLQLKPMSLMTTSFVSVRIPAVCQSSRSSMIVSINSSPSSTPINRTTNTSLVRSPVVTSAEMKMSVNTPRVNSFLDSRSTLPSQSVVVPPFLPAYSTTKTFVSTASQSSNTSYVASTNKFVRSSSSSCNPSLSSSMLVPIVYQPRSVVTPSVNETQNFSIVSSISRSIITGINQGPRSSFVPTNRQCSRLSLILSADRPPFQRPLLSVDTNQFSTLSSCVSTLNSESPIVSESLSSRSHLNVSLNISEAQKSGFRTMSENIVNRDEKQIVNNNNCNLFSVRSDISPLQTSTPSRSGFQFKKVTTGSPLLEANFVNNSINVANPIRK